MQLNTSRPYNTQAYAYASQTRGDRANSFARDVVPAVASQAIQTQGFTAAAGLGTTAAASSAGSTVGTAAGAFGSGFSVIAGAKGAYDLAKNWGKSTPAQGAVSGMAAGAAIGSVIPGIGTIIGGAVGAVVGGLAGFIKSGKHKDQVARDQVRAALKDAGIIDENYKIKLADGSGYDIGIDGGPKAEFGGLRPYEVNFQNPLAGHAVSWLNPAISILTGGDRKLTTDFVGYFANAALSNAKSLDDVRANVNAILSQLGLSDDSLAAGIQSQVSQGIIPADLANVYMTGISERQQSGVDFSPLKQTSDLAQA